MTDLNAGPELDRLVAEKVMGWGDCLQQSLDLQDELITRRGIEGPEEDRIMEEIDRMVYRQGPFPKFSWSSSGGRIPSYDYTEVFRSAEDEENYDEDCGASLRWSPSTNIAHAWEVIEKLHRDYCITISLDRGFGVQVWLHSGKVDGIDPNITTETACLSICRAALAAVSK